MFLLGVLLGVLVVSLVVASFSFLANRKVFSTRSAVFVLGAACQMVSRIVLAVVLCLPVTHQH